ncbi:MAG: AraC family transcriptional regulator [Flavobacteriales bacterium]
MKLTIRNMVCDRCKAAVERMLRAQGLPITHLDLGEVELGRTPSEAELEELRFRLEQEGFELMDDRTAAMVARIKTAIVKLVHHSEAMQGRVKLSEYLATALGRDHSTLSKLFSQVEGSTIEQYFLLQRLERVKELIKYDELTLSEIADRMGFSSVAHLSAQFKKLTGMTPSAFKTLGAGRTPLDRVG